ncbi:MAG: hypothetical protein ACRDZ9_04355 [Acidimicrobiales bacterium]
MAPSPTFARSLLERLERVLADEGLADAEMDRHHGVELPAREAASLIGTDHHLGPPLGGGT